MAFKYSFASQYNRTRLFDIDTEGLEYHELSDIFSNEDEVFHVEGIYINNKGLFDPRPCVVANSGDFRGYVNLPAHLTQNCEEILRDTNAVKAINAGRVGFTIYRYYAKNYNDRECYSIRWVDIN
jgi:hypothetical protein